MTPFIKICFDEEENQNTLKQRYSINADLEFRKIQ